MIAHSLQLYRVSGRPESGVTPDSTAVYEIITGERGPLDLGETWPALHVLLTHGEPPMPRHVALEQGLDWDETSADNILMGGEATPYEDSLTVARYLAPAAVRSLVPLLSDPNPDEFDDYLLDYLPEGWSIARARDELCMQAARLRAWYQATASAGDGLLLYVAEVPMKKKLIRVGFYKELKHGRPDGESLTAALSTSAGPDDAKLVQYLKAGATMMVAPGPMRDVLAANAIIGTLEIRTDGTYAWPSDLPHYIERHHARVPAEFTEHARASGFAMPSSIDLSMVELG